jgi:hypothetical protein
MRLPLNEGGRSREDSREGAKPRRKKQKGLGWDRFAALRLCARLSVRANEGRRSWKGSRQAAKPRRKQQKGWAGIASRLCGSARVSPFARTKAVDPGRARAKPRSREGSSRRGWAGIALRLCGSARVSRLERTEAVDPGRTRAKPRSREGRGRRVGLGSPCGSAALRASSRSPGRRASILGGLAPSREAAKDHWVRRVSPSTP